MYNIVFLMFQNSCTNLPCKIGYYKSTSSGNCDECSSNCQSCSGPGSNCISCWGGQLLLQGQCVNQCGIKYYTNGSQCLECHYSCKGCLGPDARDCLQCAPGSLRQNNECVGSCSTGESIAINVFAIKNRL